MGVTTVTRVTQWQVGQVVNPSLITALCRGCPQFEQLFALAEILDVPLSRLTEPDVNSEPSLLASLKFSAKLELDAIDRALNALNDIQVSASALGLTVGYLEEVAGDKEFDFDGTIATARNYYEPLACPGIKPAIEQLEKLLTESQAIVNYLK